MGRQALEECRGVEPWPKVVRALGKNLTSQGRQRLMTILKYLGSRSRAHLAPYLETRRILWSAFGAPFEALAKGWLTLSVSHRCSLRLMGAGFRGCQVQLG